jgi:D-glycero-D-manno-heptose 1,7-bisphosphate phosphatase
MVRTSHRLIRAILLDRDGVINRERRDYVKSWEEFEFLPGALAALQRLATHPWPILVITNQSAIGRKLVSADDVDVIHRRISESVCRAGGRINGFFVCPHHPDEQCACRKPQPGLLIQAAQSFHLELTQCIFIGDSFTDYQAAAAVNCPAILVNSGHQATRDQDDGTRENHMRVPVFPDLFSAVESILNPP